MTVVEIIEPRDVPLGGPRAVTVHRTLPQRKRSLIGAWCFIDHYGPDRVPMDVPPHPHTGLATVSWLFDGRIEHRDSAGNHAFVVPGELNLMTAGRGISHSERSTSELLHGVQLWVALPSDARFGEPGFQHYAPAAVTGEGWSMREFLGPSSPVRTATPLLGAELTLNQDLTLPVDETFEHGFLVDSGTLLLEDTKVSPRDLAYVASGALSLRLRPADGPVRLLLLGGPPFGEQIVMWWNFVGRSTEEIREFRTAWMHEAENGPGEAFGMPDGDPDPPLPAPVLPDVQLRPRG